MFALQTFSAVNFWLAKKLTELLYRKKRKKPPYKTLIISATDMMKKRKKRLHQLQSI